MLLDEFASRYPLIQLIDGAAELCFSTMSFILVGGGLLVCPVLFFLIVGRHAPVQGAAVSGC